MTENINNPYADIIDTVAQADGAMDVTQADKGGFTRVPARAGVALFRFKSYIETGQHTVEKGMGKGKVQNWADFEFELVHPDHMIGPDDNKFPDTISLRNINISKNEKAKYFKLFQKMNYEGKAKSFPELLGQGFLGRVVHNVSGDTTYVNMEEDGVFLIGAPRYEPDPVGQPGVIREIAVPELQGDIQCFLFDAPGATAEMVQRMWDGITITGEKADGTPRKDWICDKIRSANNWEGSFVQSVVGGSATATQAVADDIAAATTAAADGSADDSPIDTSKAEAAGATVVDPLADIPGL